MLRSVSSAAAVLLFLVLPASPAFGQTGANVLVVANGGSPDSLRIAEHYAQVRNVPSGQILRITADASADEIDRAVFDRQIQQPISQWLTSNLAQDHILYIVLTKGIPLRIKGTAGRAGTVASVDSELTLLYRRLTGVMATVPGQVPNPYYLEGGAAAKARRFSRADHDIYLVTRLDGFTADEVIALIDRAGKPSAEGKIVLDEKAGLGDAPGDRWLRAAADALLALGFGDRVVHDATTRVVSGEKEVLGYYSWGSNDPAVSSRQAGPAFVPGAIGGFFVSTDARTFKEPPAEWTIASWNERTKFYAGSPQSLTGDLVRAGITGASGYVAEPYLDATVRPDILFPAYLSGFNLAEAFYLALPSLSWQAVIIGDPLCAPFERKPLASSDVDKGPDAATELPSYFSERRAKALTTGVARPDAVRLMLRAEARTARGDKAGAQKALEEATRLDASLTTAHLLLATAYEEQNEHDKAIERYRQVLASNPRHAAALNNLAYALAVRKGEPAQALAYAERAHTLAPAPVVADTLGWVLHLLGRDQEAVRLLADAVRGLPDNAEVRLHAAVVYAARGMVDAATKELAEALRLEPALESRPEVEQVRRRTGGEA